MASSTAKLNHLRIAPRKVRIVADLIRGQSVNAALNVLKFTPKSAAKPLAKLLRSAVANAEQHDKNLDVDRLMVHTITVDQGPTLRRFMPRAMGRASRINKKTSHVQVVLKISGPPLVSQRGPRRELWVRKSIRSVCAWASSKPGTASGTKRRTTPSGFMRTSGCASTSRRSSVTPASPRSRSSAPPTA